MAKICIMFGMMWLGFLTVTGMHQGREYREPSVHKAKVGSDSLAFTIHDAWAEQDSNGREQTLEKHGFMVADLHKNHKRFQGKEQLRARLSEALKFLLRKQSNEAEYIRNDLQMNISIYANILNSEDAKIVWSYLLNSNGVKGRIEFTMGANYRKTSDDDQSGSGKYDGFARVHEDWNTLQTYAKYMGEYLSYNFGGRTDDTEPCSFWKYLKKTVYPGDAKPENPGFKLVKEHAKGLIPYNVWCPLKHVPFNDLAIISPENLTQDDIVAPLSDADKDSLTHKGNWKQREEKYTNFMGKLTKQKWFAYWGMDIDEFLIFKTAGKVQNSQFHFSIMNQKDKREDGDYRESLDFRVLMNPNQENVTEKEVSEAIERVLQAQSGVGGGQVALMKAGGCRGGASGLKWPRAQRKLTERLAEKL